MFTEWKRTQLGITCALQCTVLISYIQFFHRELGDGIVEEYLAEPAVGLIFTQAEARKCSYRKHDVKRIELNTNKPAWNNRLSVILMRNSHDDTQTSLANLHHWILAVTMR
jgi:hypothetical protein